MKVNEIFYSIQGESSLAGRPCAFIRLTACNLRCTYCDTEYAFYEGKEMSIDEVVSSVTSYPTRLVLVTGGEPMLQSDIHILLGALLGRGYTVCLETGGQASLREVDPRVRKVMDLKCPSSGMEAHNDYSNIDWLTRGDEVKFVVGDRADFDWAVGKIREFDLASRVAHVLLSPVYGKLPYHELAHWLLDSGAPARLQLQLHRIIWPDRNRGV